MKQQRGEHETGRDAGGPGSSHQGGGHGRAHRPQREDGDPAPGQPTNPDRSRVGGGGGERDRHHSHDPERKG